MFGTTAWQPFGQDPSGSVCVCVLLFVCVWPGQRGIGADTWPKHALTSASRRPYILGVYMTSLHMQARLLHLHARVCIPELSSILVRKFHAALHGRLGDRVAPFPDWIPRD